MVFNRFERFTSFKPPAMPVVYDSSASSYVWKKNSGKRSRPDSKPQHLSCLFCVGNRAIKFFSDTCNPFNKLSV